MAARVDIDDVDGFDLIHEFIHRETREGVNTPGSKPRRGSRSPRSARPRGASLVVAIPSRRSWSGLRGSPCRYRRHRCRCRLGHGHVHERRAHVDDDLAAGLLDQGGHGIGVHSVNGMRLEDAACFIAFFSCTLAMTPRWRPCGWRYASHPNGHYSARIYAPTCATPRADDKNIAFHSVDLFLVTTGRRRNRHNRNRAPFGWFRPTRAPRCRASSRR